MLSPFSYVAQQRKAERRDVDVVAKSIENLTLLKFLTTEYDHGAIRAQRLVVVRVTDSLPRHQHHQVDREMRLSFYPKARPASSRRHLQTWDDTEVGRFALDSFREVGILELMMTLRRFLSKRFSRSTGRG